MMHSFAEAWCLHTFLFQWKGEDHAAQSESFCTLQLKCSVVHSPNSVYFAIFLQRAMTKNLNQVYSLKTCVCHTNWQSALPNKSKLLYPIKVNNVQANPPLFRLWFSSICCLCRDRWLGLWSSQVVVGFRISKYHWRSRVGQRRSNKGATIAHWNGGSQSKIFW